MDKTTKKFKRIAFFGDADLKPNSDTYKSAYDTAKLLAKAGYIIVNGGGPGIMGAATNGAKDGGGTVELVVMDPKFIPNNYEGIDDENLKFSSKTYYEKTYPDRLNKLVEIADAFVVFKGGTGTLSEVGLVWENAKFEYGHHEPVIFFGKEWREIIALIEKDMNYQNIEKRVVTVVDTPEEVLEILKKI
ncbi:MAG: LOG family protein [Candidatus Shapirobacteria bacterium]